MKASHAESTGHRDMAATKHTLREKVTDCDAIWCVFASSSDTIPDRICSVLNYASA